MPLKRLKWLIFKQVKKAPIYTFSTAIFSLKPEQWHGNRSEVKKLRNSMRGFGNNPCFLGYGDKMSNLLQSGTIRGHN